MSITMLIQYVVQDKRIKFSYDFIRAFSILTPFS